MAAPANDDFANAELLPGAGGVVTSELIDDATVEGAEQFSPTVGPSPGNQTIWYQWVALVSGPATFSVSPGDFEPIIAVWTGSTLGALTLVDAVDDPFTDPTALTIDVEAGETYYIQIGTWGGYTDTAWTLTYLSTFPARRTFEGRTWKWIVSDLKTSRTLTAISTFATDITTARLLAAPWPASCTVPSDDPRVNTVYEQFDDPAWDEPFVARNIRALIGFRDTGAAPLYEVAYTGIILQVYDSADEGVPVSKINAWDARKYLEFVPLVDEDGNLPGADGLTFTATKANAIARAALENWITNNPACLASIIFDLAAGVDEDCAEIDITFGQGMMVADVWTQLEQMGVIDITLAPVYDPINRPGVLSAVNFEVEHGSQRNAALFAWGLSPRSLPNIGRLEDGLKLANTIQGYTGDTVTPVTPQTDADSIAKYGEYWSLRSWPGQEIAAAVEAFGIEDLVFRRNGQTTLSATPAAARAAQPVQDYDYGDRAPFYADRALRKAIAGLARIYGIPFLIGVDGQESVDQLIVSADAVG